ncbi:hypothetical protein DUI87_16553 [Hirundo rustica rustica]|uniref:Uncharacterized protein n=1 Tax=Hirundo rustica rustica TaxID=333673 RepID=A0A3M0KIT3_HIRRU|nr:hypothetical protein DUI87_16553 [Hirundo rustica rustica]
MLLVSYLPASVPRFHSLSKIDGKSYVRNACLTLPDDDKTSHQQAIEDSISAEIAMERPKKYPTANKVTTQHGYQLPKRVQKKRKLREEEGEIMMNGKEKKVCEATYLTMSSTDGWKILLEAIFHALFENTHEYLVNIVVYYTVKFSIRSPLTGKYVHQGLVSKEKDILKRKCLKMKPGLDRGHLVRPYGVVTQKKMDFIGKQFTTTADLQAISTAGGTRPQGGSGKLCNGVCLPIGPSLVGTLWFHTAATSNLDWNGLEWIGLDWNGLDWIGLDWIGLDWIGLEWIGLEWIGLD